MQTIKPAKNQLFCKPDDAELKIGSIYVGEKSVAKPRTAKVINTGDAVVHFKANDTIIYKTYSTTDIKLNGVDFFLVSEEDVLGTVIETE